MSLQHFQENSPFLFGRRREQEESLLDPEIERQTQTVPGFQNMCDTCSFEASDLHDNFPFLAAKPYYHIGNPGCPVIREENKFCGLVEQRFTFTECGSENDATKPSFTSTIEKAAMAHVADEVALIVKQIRMRVTPLMPHLVAIPFDGMMLSIVAYQKCADGRYILPGDDEFCEFKFIPGTNEEMHKSGSAGVSRNAALPLGMVLHPPPQDGGDLTYCMVHPVVRLLRRGFYCTSGTPPAVQVGKKEDNDDDDDATAATKKERIQTYYPGCPFRPAKQMYRPRMVHQLITATSMAEEETEEEKELARRRRQHACARAMPVLLFKTPLSYRCRSICCFVRTWVMRDARTNELITNAMHDRVNDLPAGAMLVQQHQVVGGGQIVLSTNGSEGGRRIAVVVWEETWGFEVPVWAKVYLPLDCHGFECGVEFPRHETYLDGLALPVQLSMNMIPMFGDPDLVVYEEGNVMHFTQHPLLLVDDRVDLEDFNISLAVNLDFLEEEKTRFVKMPYYFWLVPKEGGREEHPRSVDLVLKQYWTGYARDYSSPEQCMNSDGNGNGDKEWES